jgi:hypothetical protein
VGFGRSITKSMAIPNFSASWWGVGRLMPGSRRHPVLQFADVSGSMLEAQGTQRIQPDSHPLTILPWPAKGIGR